MKKPRSGNSPEPADRQGSAYTYQKNSGYFAQIAEGLEPLAEQELVRLGAKKIQSGYRGLYFSADKETLYRVTYQSRLIQKK